MGSIVMVSDVCLCFSVHDEDIFLSLLVQGVFCVHFSQLIDHCVM